MDNAVTPWLPVNPNTIPRLAIFLSGSGSNAEKILERARDTSPETPFRVAALVTDAPRLSRARELAEIFDIPLVENDIRTFYRNHGESRVSVATPQGQRLRETWTNALREQLRPLAIDFAVFAGFVPLTNLTEDMPCLNVHPGDLTYIKNGQRFLTGLHTVPIERAICEGLQTMRSSVIIALPYTGKGDDMDKGPVLGISRPIPIDLQDADLEELRACAAARPQQRPKGGFQDKLEQIAKQNQERLKQQGDWTVFPSVVLDFARGLFGNDPRGQLCYRLKNRWRPIKTVVYDQNDREILFRCNG